MNILKLISVMTLTSMVAACGSTPRPYVTENVTEKKLLIIGLAILKTKTKLPSSVNFYPLNHCMVMMRLTHLGAKMNLY